MNDVSRYIKEAIISPADLRDLLEAYPEHIVLLDASYGAGVSGLHPDIVFDQMRIAHAGRFDIDLIADTESPFPHMLPSAEKFADAAGRLGISNDHLVVVYDQTGIAMAAARAWWMFRVFGHENVCVLDGGLPAWHAAGLPFATSAPALPERQIFSPSYRADLVRTYEEMKSLVATDSAFILDTRPSLRGGHIPGSVNLPAGMLIDPATHGLRSPHERQALLDSAKLDREKPVIASCGSGITACVMALTLHSLGYENYAVYDGSYAEWHTKELDSPVIKHCE